MYIGTTHLPESVGLSYLKQKQIRSKKTRFFNILWGYIAAFCFYGVLPNFKYNLHNT